MNNLHSFGDVLKTLRKRKRISQRALATKLDIHYNTVWAWERGDYLPKTRGIVLEIARHIKANEQETQTLLEASLTVTTRNCIIPYQRNPFFTGREELLQYLHNCFQSMPLHNLFHPYALSGMGGVGKTQIALEYAYRYAFEYTGIFWIQAETPETLTHSFSLLANLFNLSEVQKREQQQMISAVLQWFITHHNWLLIYDNVDDLDLLTPWLPQSFYQGSILLTTRLQVTEPCAFAISVDPFVDKEAACLLLRRARRLALDETFEMGKPDDQVQALITAQKLGGLPLALDQAGAYILETGCPFSEYLCLYGEQQIKILARRGSSISQHTDSVITTFTLALQDIRQRNCAAIALLQLMACFNADHIPDALLRAKIPVLDPLLRSFAHDTLEFYTAIALLRSRSLIQRNTQEQTISLHRLVQVVIRNAMTTWELHDRREQCLLLLHKQFPSDHADVEHWPWCDLLVPHVLASAQQYQSDGNFKQEATELFYRTAQYLNERAQYKQACSLFLLTLQIKENLSGSSHPDLIPVLNDIGWLYYNQGDYTETEQIYTRALAICDQHFDSFHTQRAITLNNCAVLYNKQGKYELVEPMYLQALHSHEKQLGANHAETLATLNNLAIFYHDQGKYDQALCYYLRSFQAKEASLGLKHPLTATTQNNIAMLYQDQGQYWLAEPLFLQALQTREGLLGPFHPLTAQSLSNLAKLYCLQGKYEQAEHLGARALTICETHLVPFHPFRATALTVLGNIAACQKNYDTAEHLYIQALTIYDNIPGSQKNRKRMYCLTDLTLLFIDRKLYVQAEAFGRKAFQLSEAQPVSNPLLLATSCHVMGVLSMAQHDYIQAADLFHRSLSIREQIFPDGHPDSAETLFQLAVLQQQLGQIEQALPFYERAFLVQKQILGYDHPHTRRTATCYYNLQRETGYGSALCGSMTGSNDVQVTICAESKSSYEEQDQLIDCPYDQQECRFLKKGEEK